ncbi:DUF3152 domain-containing protein [Pilimelia columellifera]|uniref:DUF3152 domain-containing protein n=1 Tax=Pilimelia columellifera subsp. columellifera TaxID=706583 RepID=A0ABP6APA2_9ACTN
MVTPARPRSRPDSVDRPVRQGAEPPDWHGPTPAGGVPLSGRREHQRPRALRGRLTPAGRAALDAAEAVEHVVRPGAGGSSAMRDARRRFALRRRMLTRRRRSLLLLLLVLAAGLIVVDVVRGPAEKPAGPGAGTAPAPDPVSEPPSPAQTAPRAAAFPGSGSGRFGWVGRTGPVHGRAGQLLRYRVAVELGAGQNGPEFAAEVGQILGDARGWSASRVFRFQQVSAAVPAQFTVYLATPATSERMCAAAGLRTQRYTNCRLAGKVIINMARWWQSVPGYGAPLAEYRAYAVNHEVGHQLGRGHERCPGRDRLAPVMQQQTLGLAGCKANAWPYYRGRRYAGPAVG